MFRPLGTFSIAKPSLELLNNNGFYYWGDILKAPDVAKKFINLDEMEKLCIPPETSPALDNWQAELLCERVTTFNKALDALLDGGFNSGTITEICGAQGTGKTQICFQLCITTQLSQDRGGMNGRVLFIDSRNGFSSIRLLDILGAFQRDHVDFGLKEEQVLENVTIVTAITAKELFITVKSIREYLKSNDGIRVIIVDSLSLPVLGSIHETIIKAEYYFKILNELQYLATKHSIAIIIVNELATQVDAKGNIGVFSAGGQAVAHRCQKRLLLARLDDTLFAVKLLKSPTLPQISKTFQITIDGLKN